MLRAWAAALLIGVSATPAWAQRCPPNSSAQAVGIPGNLRTAQCFCNRGFVAVRGVCVPAQNTHAPPPRNPSDALVAPRP